MIAAAARRRRGCRRSTSASPTARALIDLMKVVSTEIEIVMDGRAYERRAGGFPPLDTGILGPVPGPTGTSVIVGFGPSLFDARYRPRRRSVRTSWSPMPHFANDYLVDDGAQPR